jgi:hypothetical protein
MLPFSKAACLIAAVDHAIGTFFVVGGSVLVPICALHQLLEALGVAFTQKIAGALPAEDGARRVAPRRAPVGLIASQKIKEQLRLKQRPCASSWRTAEDLPKQLFRVRAMEKVLLVRGTLVGISGRDRDTVHAQRPHIVEEPGNALRLGVGEECAVDVDAEAL